MMRLSLILLLPVLFVLAGCSSTAPTGTNANVDSTGQAVSSVPWNKPESWESSGQLGGMTGN